MNIMVLGSAGYLGSNIVDSLSRKGENVFCVVRSSIEISRITGLNGTLIYSDIQSIEKALKNNRIDWIINTVCTYRSNSSLYADLYESNLFFPTKVLNLAIMYGCKNFMTMGTSLPQNTNVYSFTKNQFSQVGEFHALNDGINFADLRLEMFYGGKSELDTRFLTSCINKLIANEKLELTEGSQKRDVIRVEDVIGIIYKLIRSNYAKGYKVLPVGSGEQHPIREIVQFMKRELESKSELEFGAISCRRIEPETKADISWLEDIGYKLEYEFWDGIRDECNRKREGSHN